jgi:ABC-type Fe3+ transport system substrate-binding protein
MKLSALSVLGLTALLGIAGAPALAQTAERYPGEKALYDAAVAEKTLTWYFSIPAAAARALGSEFEQQYPGVTVEGIFAPSSLGYQRFLTETENKQYVADVVNISDRPLMNQLNAAGHLMQHKVPAFDQIPSGFRAGEWSYAPTATELVVIYNTNKVTPEEAKLLEEWEGVLDPAFANGRLGVAAMRNCGTCYAGLHMFLDPAPEMQKRFGTEFLKKIAAQKPKVYTDVIVALDRVVAGEIDVYFFLHDAAANSKWAVGAPIRWTKPSPTPMFGGGWTSVSANTTRPNAAKLFLNWYAGPDGAAAIQKHYGRSILEGIADTRKVAAEPWYVQVKDRYDVDFDRWEKTFISYNDIWFDILQQQ